MKLGANIRACRLEARLSQEELGARLGISGQAVSKWEQGVTSPDLTVLPLLSEIFGVTIDSLFRDQPERIYSGYGSRRAELAANYSHSGSEEDFNAAAQAYAEVILNGSPAVDDYRSYALLHNLRARRDAETAIRYYRRAIAEGAQKRDIHWMSAHQELTHLLQWTGRLNEAVFDWQEWCQREPDCCWAHVSYAHALELTCDSTAACEEAMTAVSLNPDDLNAQTLAGDLLGKLGRLEEACLHWERAFEIDPTQISCLFSMAEAFAAAGRTQDAVSQFRRILQWLKENGYNLAIEGEHPRKRIQELLSEQ